MTPVMKSLGFRYIPAVLAMVVGFTTFIPTTADARDDFSMGVVLGDPSGLTLRGGIDGRSAIQAHLGFSFFPGDAVSAMVDWTYDAFDFLRSNRSASMYFYFGFGGKAMWFTGRNFVYEHNNRYSFPDNSYFGFGVRGLVGFRVAFRNAPFDIFFEVAPIGLTVVTPDPDLYYDIDGAVGFRFRF